MSGGDAFRPAKRSWSERATAIGQRICVLKGPFAELLGSTVKNYGGGRWAVKLDGLRDGVYLILTDDWFIVERPDDKPPLPPQTKP